MQNDIGIWQIFRCKREMYCSKCGKELTVKEKFCPRCRNAVEAMWTEIKYKGEKNEAGAF